jgi:hypothetical protein
MTFADPDAGHPPLYPIRLWMEYPERLSRLSSAFRVVLAIPVAIFLSMLGGGLAGAGMAAVLVRGNMPRWLFDVQTGYQRFSSRAAAYFLLLTDQYPAFEGDWYVQYWADYPPRLSRWKVLVWKVIAAIPHFVALIGLWIAVVVVTFIAWFAILFTGSYPRGMHTFVVGVLRWTARVSAYVTSLTDEFPPFSLEHDAAPGRQERAFAIAGAAVTVFVIAAAIGIGIAVYLFTTEVESVSVSYEDALAGTLDPRDAFRDMDSVGFGLTGGVDDVAPSAYGDLIQPEDGNRFVEFTVAYQNVQESEDQPFGEADVERDTLRLKTSEDDSVSPVILTADGFVAPTDVERESTYELRAVFEIGEDDEVLELQAYPVSGLRRHIAWEFE